MVLGPIRDADTYLGSNGNGSTSVSTRDLAVGEMPAYAASRWLRISDDSVEEVGVERVLAETAGTFMLYYERVVQPRPALWPVQSSPRSSEETIKPVGVHDGVGDVGAILDVGGGVGMGMGMGIGGLGSELGVEMGHPHVRGARIVRSVYAGRSRSPSVRDLSPASSLLESMSSSVGDDSEPEWESNASTPTPTPTREMRELANGVEVGDNGVAMLREEATLTNGVVLHEEEKERAMLTNGVLSCPTPNGDVVHEDEDDTPTGKHFEVPGASISAKAHSGRSMSPSRSSQHVRVASPQPTHTPSPARTVGLRA